MVFWANDTLNLNSSIPASNPCDPSYDGYLRINDTAYGSGVIDTYNLYQKNSTCLLRSMELFAVCSYDTVAVDQQALAQNITQGMNFQI